MKYLSMKLWIVTLLFFCCPLPLPPSEPSIHQNVIFTFFREQDHSAGNEPSVLKIITKYTIIKMCYLEARQMTQKLGTCTVLTKHPSPQNPCLGGSYQPIAPVRGRSNSSDLLKYLYTWAHIHTEHTCIHIKKDLNP